METEINKTRADEIAAALCEHFTDGRPGDTPLSGIPRCTEPFFSAHYLNGPGADLVMLSNSYRWLSVRADDISSLVTVADLLALCRRHLVSVDGGHVTV